LTHGPAQDEPIALPLALGLVGLVGAVLTDGLAQWVAVAAGLTAAPSLLRRVATYPAWQRRKDRIPLALVLVFCVWLLGDLLLGRPPASRDHGIHLYQVHLLLEDMLPRGRLMGWTDQFNNGLPFGEAYPWFPHLWAALPHLLSGGLIPVRVGYAWALAAMWLLGVLGVWLMAREVAREVTEASEEPDDRRASLVAWAGALGALTWLLDPGGSRQGGWNYLMFHGVWPQMLSATLWVLALPLCWRAFKKASPRRLAIATLVLGGSVLAHPFGLLTMVCSAAVWIAVLALVPSASRLPGSRWVAFLAIHLGAAMIGYGWLSSFLAGAEVLGRSPVPWDSIGTMASELLRGELFGGHAAWSGPLALIGLVAAIRRGGSIAWLVVGLVLGMLVLGSQAAITVLRLDLIVAGFKNLQFPRYSIAIKPLYFALSGVGASVVAHAVRRMLAARAGRTVVERFVIGLVLAPFVLSIATEPDRLVTRPVGGIETLQDAGLVGAEADLRQALEEEQAGLGEQLMTVAVFRAGMGGGTYAVMSVAEVGARLIVDGHVPTINVEHRITRRNVHGLYALGVTHVIYDKPLEDEKDEPFVGALETVGEYGPYTLARLVRGVPGKQVEWKGGATVDWDNPAPDRWTIDVSALDKPTAIRLPFLLHPKWQATLDGEARELETSPRWGGTAVGASVTLRKGGRLELQYVDSERETRSRWLALIVAVGCVVAMAVGSPLPLPSWTPSPAAARIGLAGLAVAIVLGAWWVTRRQRTLLAETFTHLAQGHRPTKTFEASVVTDAVSDDAITVERSWDHVCLGIFGKDALDGCNESEHAPHTSFLYRKPYLYRCLELTVPPSGVAELHLDLEVPDKSWVTGLLRRRNRKGKGENLEYRTLGEWGPIGNSTRDFQFASDQVGDGALIEVRNESGRLEPICVVMAVLEP